MSRYEAENHTDKEKIREHDKGYSSLAGEGMHSFGWSTCLGVRRFYYFYLYNVRKKYSKSFL